MQAYVDNIDELGARHADLEYDPAHSLAYLAAYDRTMTDIADVVRAADRDPALDPAARGEVADRAEEELDLVATRAYSRNCTELPDPDADADAYALRVASAGGEGLVVVERSL